LFNHFRCFPVAVSLLLIDDTKVRYSNLTVKNIKRRLLNGTVGI